MKKPIKEKIMKMSKEIIQKNSIQNVNQSSNQDVNHSFENDYDQLSIFERNSLHENIINLQIDLKNNHQSVRVLPFRSLLSRYEVKPD
jgi:hypothetical protein